MNPFDRDILRLALPSIITNITVPLLGLADVAIVGHIGGASFIGAIAVGSMIFNVMYWLFGFLRMGTSGLTAQAFGAGQTAEAWAVLRRSLTVALGAGVLIIVLQWPLRLLAFWLMAPTPDVQVLVTPYYNICVWGAPATLALYALTGWFVGMQNTRLPMLIAIGQNVVNILASVLLVFAAGMQIEGVALGTVVAQWTGFLFAMTALRRWRRTSDRSGSTPNEADNASAATVANAHPRQPSTYRSFFRLNRDIFLRTLCLVSVNLYFTSAGAQQGALTLAVNTLLMQLYLLFSFFLDGFAYAGEALTGRYYGAGDTLALQQVVRRLFRWGLLMMLFFTAVYWAGGNAFLRLLTTDEGVVQAAGSYYGWALLIPLCGVAAFVWDGIFIGLTATRGMLWSCLSGAVAFFAVWLSLRGLWGNHALWLAFILYMSVRGGTQTLIWFSRKIY